MLIGDDFWEVKETKDRGRGIFAKKVIKQGVVICDYLGKVINMADYDLELDKQGLYLMYYSDQAAIYPDLTKSGPHLFNHSCAPNCRIYIYRGHTLFFALKKIAPGEDLTISYLLSPNTCGKDCPHICKCGAKKCTGTMHQSKIQYAKRQKTNPSRRAKFVFGQDLPPLLIYPKHIVFVSGAGSRPNNKADASPF